MKKRSILLISMILISTTMSGCASLRMQYSIVKDIGEMIFQDKEDEDDSKDVDTVDNDITSDDSDIYSDYDYDIQDGIEDDITKPETKIDNERIVNFENAELSFKYPSKYSKLNQEGCELSISDYESFVMNLIIESTQGLSENEYNRLSDESVKRDLNIVNDEIYVENTKFNGYKSRVTMYTQKTKKGNFTTIQSTFIRDNGKAYIFTFMSPNNDSNALSSFEQILNTISFK